MEMWVSEFLNPLDMEQSSGLKKVQNIIKLDGLSAICLRLPVSPIVSDVSQLLHPAVASNVSKRPEKHAYVRMFALPVSVSDKDPNGQGFSSSHRAVRSPQRLSLGEKSLRGQFFGLAEKFQFPPWLPIHSQWK